MRAKRWFTVGLAIRLAWAPFLLQWFHPDERQTIELAHFLAHGRLHPFMETALHLRNLTTPWLLSWVIRFADISGLSSWLGAPRAELLLIHAVLGCWSWIGFAALVACVRELVSRAEPSRARRAESALGWFFALFWGFPFLYSRMLLEALSFPPAALLLLYLLRARPSAAGFWAGAAAAVRYPSALWAVGAACIKKVGPTFLLKFASCFALAVALGGLVDWRVYGRFLASAPAYWAFNHPHGPVEAMFGSDSLEVYWRWFEYLFTPWIAVIFLAISAYALSLRSNRKLLFFTLPYLAGHLWTPHREPRFMLPLTPFLCLAIAVAWASGEMSPLRRRWRALPKAARAAVLALAWAHVAMNFAWHGLQAWAQTRSSQGALVLNSKELAARPGELICRGDPPIDALIPPEVRWADSGCKWHRPALPERPSVLWLIAPEAPKECKLRSAPAPASQALQRVLRVRFGALWECPVSLLSRLCPDGTREAPRGEPFFGERL